MASKLSRRQFLKLTGAATAGSWMLANVPASLAKGLNSPVGQVDEGVEGDVTWLVNLGEFSEEEVNLFMEKYPGVSLTLEEFEQTRLFAMFAAGEAPDAWRVQYMAFPQLLARDLVMNIQPYMDATTVLSEDDLVPANNVYRAEDPFNVGTGPLYALIKDWAPDMTIWVNDQLFEDAGVPLLSVDEPLTYEEVYEVAKSVAQFDGERIAKIAYHFELNWVDRYWQAWLTAMGRSIFSDDYMSMNMVDNEEAREMAQWHLTMAGDRLADGPLVENFGGWWGPDFVNSNLAIAQTGYWFSAFLRINSGEVQEFVDLMDAGKIRYLPAPMWKGVRSSPSITATAHVIYKDTPNPDATWLSYRYYNAEEPAITRAEIGWGVPALQSLFPLMPQTGTYSEITYNALMAELEYTDTIIQANPFLPGGEPGAIAAEFLGSWENVLLGDQSFDDLIQDIEDETNLVIEDNAFDMGF